VVLGALVVGGGIGLVLGHTGRGGLVAVNAANAARAVPTLALLTLFAIQPSISLKWGGFLAAFLALLILAIPPILTNTYVGMREVDADVRDAAKAMGLTGGQVLRRVELPLATPFSWRGSGPLRSRSWPLRRSRLCELHGPRTPVISGLSTENTVEAFSGAILVAVLAGAVALGLGVLGRRSRRCPSVTPAPARHSRRREP